MTRTWSLRCSHCEAEGSPVGLPTVCPACASPWLVLYGSHPSPAVKHKLAGRPWDMWRYREWLPLQDEEQPVSLGEGMTPLMRWSPLERRYGLDRVWIKDESQNPTGSFKARGLAAAVTAAVRGGATRFTIPTAGNAGVALAAYARRAGIDVHVFAPRTTPATILAQIRAFGADLRLLDGHIGDCGKAAREFAAANGAFDMSTLREPYRIEGKKTLGLEVAEQLDWTLPSVILYPAGGGTGLIGMWKTFNELRAAGWVNDAPPRLFAVQSAGCAPVVKAYEAGADVTETWSDPQTVASGLRVPGPLGGRLMLRAIRETGGGAVAVSDESLTAAQHHLARSGLDASPEGGAAAAALGVLRERGAISANDSVVVFNTGAGWLYR